MTEKQKAELRAVADFIDWLCDNGYVIARSSRGDWRPIAESEALSMVQNFLESENA